MAKRLIKRADAGQLCVKMTPFKVKAIGTDDDLEEGVFEGYASVFGNVDSYGDIVEPGAFKRTLAEWEEKGDTIPVLWGHDLYDPFNNIGGLLSASEDERGLLVKGQLDLDNPTAAQVYRLMKGRRTNKMSFAYAIAKAEDADDGYHLKDLDLFEVSVVQIPANQEAEILAVKQATASLIKAGRVLSAKNETALKTARDSIDSVLKALESQDPDDEEDGKGAEASGTQEQQASGKTAANDGASAEDPATGNASVSSEEPKSGPSVEAMGSLFDTYAMAFSHND